MASGGKVVHVSDELHARLRAYCVARELHMSKWVEQVVDAAMAEPTEPTEPSEPAPPPPPPASPVLEPVAKKQLPEITEETGDEPWARPPFWATTGRRSA